MVNLKISGTERYRISDAVLTPTFNPRWWLVEGQTELRTYSEHAGTRSVNKRYVLINSTVEGPPAIIPAEEV